MIITHRRDAVGESADIPARVRRVFGDEVRVAFDMFFLPF